MEKKYLRDNELLSKEYYHEKNVDIDFDALTLGSNKHVWWICSSCGWSWNTTVGNRGISKRGCPECAKKKISKTLERNAAKRNNFAEKYPHLVKEWHPVNNGDKTPNDVSCSSEYFAWWKCHICGCEWKAKVAKRTNRGFGCPNCAKQSTSFDEQAIFFYVKKHFSEAINRHLELDIEFDIYIPSLKVAIEYDGIVWHKQKLSKDNSKDNFCKRNNIMLYRFRDPSLPLTDNAYTISCIDGDPKELKMGIIKLLELLGISNSDDIDVERDTPKILAQYQKIKYENSIESKYPEIASEWHPILNGELLPSMIDWSSGDKVWWKCKECGFDWRAAPNKRTRKHSGTGCPECARKRINASNQVKVRNVDTGVIYNSLTEAAISCNGRKSDICTCCNGKKKTAFGYRWEYVNYSERRSDYSKYRIMNVDTGIVYDNQREAALSVNGDGRNIIKCCSGQVKTSYGYRWRFVD